MASPPWACWFCWSVWLLFLETEVFSAPLFWLTSPLPDHGLPTVTGALTFSCSLSASDSADWDVSLLLSADWSWLTSWPPSPSPLESPPLVTQRSASSWLCLFLLSFWYLSLESGC